MTSLYHCLCEKGQCWTAFRGTARTYCWLPKCALGAVAAGAVPSFSASQSSLAKTFASAVSFVSLWDQESWVETKVPLECIFYVLFVFLLRYFSLVRFRSVSLFSLTFNSLFPSDSFCSISLFISLQLLFSCLLSCWCIFTQIMFLSFFVLASIFCSIPRSLSLFPVCFLAVIFFFSYLLLLSFCFFFPLSLSVYEHLENIM